MGGLLSRLQAYIFMKIDDAKQLVRNKIDRTKQRIKQRIDDTKTSIINRVLDLKNAVKTRIDNTKTAISTRVNHTIASVVRAVRTTRDEVVGTVVNTKNRIYNRIFAIRDRICSAITAARNAVVSRVLAIILFIVSIKNATVSWITATRDAVVKRYTNTKTSVRNRYHSIRNAKLTRWQKVKYGTCAGILLFVLAVIVLTLLDIYLGDTESAVQRLNAIWSCISLVFLSVCEFMMLIATHTLHVTQFTAEVVWHWSKIAFNNGLVGAQIVGQYMYEGGLVAAEYSVAGAKIAGHQLTVGAQTCCHYAWIGMKQGSVFACDISLVVIDYTSYVATVTWHFLLTASEAGAQYAVEGCKLGASYSAKGLDYSIRHGGVALKDGSIWLYHYTIYFVTNFREASLEAAVWSWQTAKSAAEVTSAASYEGSVWLIMTISDLLVKSYYLSVQGFHWLFSTSVALVDKTVVASTSLAEYSYAAASDSFSFTLVALVAAYEKTVAFCVAVYVGTVSFINWSTSTAQMIWDWTCTFASVAYHYVYIGVTDYGYRCVIVVCNGIVEVGCFLGRVLGKFFGDLGMYVANFFYVTTSRLASIVYVLVMFIYHIIAAVGAVIKAIVGVAVFCTTRVFGVIIWFLRETIFAYLYMLHKYNMYREILFLAFVGLLSVYCTGLMRDRRRLDETDEPDGSDAEEEDQVPDSAQRVRGSASEQAMSLRDLSLATECGEMPSYDEVDTHDETLTEFAIGEHVAEEEEQELQEEDLLPELIADAEDVQ